MESHDSVLEFWFQELKPPQWFEKDLGLDTQIKERFASLHQRASRAELFTWRKTPQGRLAEIILLDQFSRNIYRDAALAFACDPLALGLAQEAVRAGDDQKLPLQERTFMYMPYMHSESERIHEEAMRLFSVPGMENTLDFEQRHKKIIDRFGRYPHRNKILGRPSTPDEIEFLKQPGSGF